ncbi:hypothetical protein NQT62_12055 [Limnobacter humi]|uniref:Alpha/beta fold hydrolase n=1 Tax=Limnobacter humi TaxID=1778671 RepID=A0ABT1WI19_9BURK|nr:hypothetical protein [Limnobacter humi]
MIRTLNRLYWVGYFLFAYTLYFVMRVWVHLSINNALTLSISLTFGLLFLAHVGFNISGFALSFSVRQLPQVRDKGLPFHSAEGEGFHSLNTWRWIKAVLAESLASFKLIMLQQPWFNIDEGIRLAPKAWKKKKPLPVLLIHGYLCNAGVWSHTRNMLEKANVTTHAITLEPAIGSIRRYSTQIHDAIEDLLKATGAPRVKILAHSMGGVATRYHVTEYGHHRIAGLMTLGSPHFGTALSSLGVGKNVRQMAWGSYFLRHLREHPSDREFQEKIISLWTPQDNIVCPPSSCKLEFGRNIAVPGCGHVSLVTDSTTEDLILNWLAEDAQAYGQK